MTDEKEWPQPSQFLRRRLGRRDFLNVPAGKRAADAAARHSPSGLGTDFSGHLCPETAGYRAEHQETSVKVMNPVEFVMEANDGGHID